MYYLHLQKTKKKVKKKIQNTNTKYKKIQKKYYIL